MLCIIPISACTIAVIVFVIVPLLLSENLEVLQWFHHSQTCLEASWDIEERVVVVVLSLSLFLWDEESLSIAVGHWNVHKWSCRMSSKYQVVDAVRSIKIFLGVLFYNRPLQPEKGSKWNWVKSKLVLREVSCLLGWAHNNLEHKINVFVSMRILWVAQQVIIYINTIYYVKENTANWSSNLPWNWKRSN